MGEAVAKEGVLDVRADVGGYAGGMGIHKLRGRPPDPQVSTLVETQSRRGASGRVSRCSV